MTHPRRFLGFVVVLVVIGLVYILFPWAAAFVRHERSKRYIKVQMSYPRCTPGKEAPDSFKCECEFILEGVTARGEVRFEGSGLRESFDPEKHTYNVSGAGVIHAGANRILVSSDSISINDTKLPSDGPSSFHVLIHSDGELENSRIDIAY
jgi:hypothetical protein